MAHAPPTSVVTVPPPPGRLLLGRGTPGLPFRRAAAVSRRVAEVWLEANATAVATGASQPPAAVSFRLKRFPLSGAATSVTVTRDLPVPSPPASSASPQATAKSLSPSSGPPQAVTTVVPPGTEMTLAVGDRVSIGGATFTLAPHPAWVVATLSSLAAAAAAAISPMGKTKNGARGGGATPSDADGEVDVLPTAGGNARKRARAEAAAAASGTFGNFSLPMGSLGDRLGDVLDRLEERQHDDYAAAAARRASPLLDAAPSGGEAAARRLSRQDVVRGAGAPADDDDAVPAESQVVLYHHDARLRLA